MEWRCAGVVVALVLVVSTLGCINPPEPPPMSRIPKVIIDHVGEDFAIYVHGMSDYRYERIEIRVDNESLFARNLTFQGDALTDKDSFILNITVFDMPSEGSEMDIYYYNASVEAHDLYFVVSDDSGEHEVFLEDSTSFITRMYLAGTESNR